MLTVQLSKDLQAQIFRQMESTYPNEGGGFLFGTVDGARIEIEAITQVENVFEEEEQYHRYAMTTADWARLEDEADERGLSLVGYYHSHPDSAPIPSEYDRHIALPNFIYIITSVQQGKSAEMRVWRLREDYTAFDAQTLQVE